MVSCVVYIYHSHRGVGWSTGFSPKDILHLVYISFLIQSHSVTDAADGVGLHVASDSYYRWVGLQHIKD